MRFHASLPAASSAEPWSCWGEPTGGQYAPHHTTEALPGPGCRFRNLQHGIMSKQALRPLPASKVNLMDSSGLPGMEDDSQKDWSVRLDRQRQAANKTRGYRCCCLLPAWHARVRLATVTAQSAWRLHDWCTCIHLAAWMLAVITVLAPAATQSHAGHALRGMASLAQPQLAHWQDLEH